MCGYESDVGTVLRHSLAVVLERGEFASLDFPAYAPTISSTSALVCAEHFQEVRWTNPLPRVSYICES